MLFMEMPLRVEEIRPADLRPENGIVGGFAFVRASAPDILTHIDREACLVRRPPEHAAPSLRTRRRRPQGSRLLPSRSRRDHLHAHRSAKGALRPRHRLETCTWRLGG